MRDRVRDPQRVLPDREQPGPGDQVAQHALPEQHVEQPHRDGPGGHHRDHDEDRVIHHRAGQRPGEHAQREPRGPPGGDEAGHQDRDRGEDHGEHAGHGVLGPDHHRPAHRRGQQVHDAAVVDLRAQDAGADDERGQREHHGQPEQAEDVHGPRGTLRVGQLQRHCDQDQDERREGEQEGALAAYRRPQGDGGDDPALESEHGWLLSIREGQAVRSRPGRRRRFPATRRRAAVPAAGFPGRGRAPRVRG